MKNERFEMRASADFLKKLDDWRREQPDLPPRSEAIRRIVDQALATDEAVDPARPTESRWVQHLHERYEAYKRDIDPDVDYPPTHFILDQDVDWLEIFKPIFCEAFGLPDDPWPGLTGDDLTQMTKGRIKEASRRGILVHGGKYEMDWKYKLVAALHRDWLIGKG